MEKEEKRKKIGNDEKMKGKEEGRKHVNTIS